MSSSARLIRRVSHTGGITYRRCGDVKQRWTVTTPPASSTAEGGVRRGWWGAEGGVGFGRLRCAHLQAVVDLNSLVGRLAP